MVKVIVNLLPQTNKVLNIVKAKQGLTTKSETIDFLVKHYEEDLLEPQLRPEYIHKMQKIAKEKHVFIGTINDFKKRYA